MKKLIIVAVSCLLLIGLIVYYFVACVGPKGKWDFTEDVTYYNMSHDYAVVGKYTGDETDIVLAHTYYKQDITTIDTEAFSATDIKSIKVPACVTTINSKAFYDCKKLEKIEFEEGSKLEYIGTDAFRGCSSLKEIVFPSGLKQMLDGAFAGCSSLKTVEIPESLTALPKEAFAGCTKLETLKLSDKITSIGADAIKDTKIYNTASNWDVIEGAGKTLYVGKYLFDTDRLIEGKYAIKDGTLVVASKAFENSTEILSVVLPQSLVNIGVEAFNGCKSLIEVHNKSNIDVQLKYKEDRNNSKGTGNVGLYAKNIFTLSSGKEILEEENGVWMYEGALVKYFGDAESVTIDADIVGINDGTFLNNKKIKEIIIPESVVSIGEDAFAGCSNLLTIKYNGTVDKWASIEFKNNQANPLACEKTDGAVANLIIGGTTLENATINVEKVRANAFNGCKTLKSVTLSNNVKAFESNAFQNCTALTKVNYQGTVEQWAKNTYANIGANPLSLAHNLYINDVLQTSISLDVEEISKLAFYGCYSLNKLTLGANVKKINQFAFTNCYYLVEAWNKSSVDVKIGSGAGDVGKYLLAVYTDDTASKLTDTAGFVVFTDGAEKTLVRYIGTATEFTLPEVTKIKSYAFVGTNIEKIIVPASVTEIGTQAFAKCTSLAAVNFADDSKLTTIANLAFDGCSGLKTFIIPETVTTIGENAFTYYKDCFIFCNIDVQPSGWKNWISKRTNVYYLGNWEMVEGVPTPIQK